MLSTSICALTLLCSLLGLVQAHTVITYPGWRGNSLHSNGSVTDTNGLNGVPGTGNNTTDLLFPYGMQWSYPCGGMPTSTNRTLWPVRGGAVAIQPGWFQGHATSYFYINMGFGTIPPNMSNPMLPGGPFQIIGPTREPYPGTFCLPQVPLPVNASVHIGDNATIQVIETAVHGAALYTCVDITFADPKDVEPVTPDNCFNSSQISFNLVFTTAALQSGASRSLVSRSSGYVAASLIAGLSFILL